MLEKGLAMLKTAHTTSFPVSAPAAAASYPIGSDRPRFTASMATGNEILSCDSHSFNHNGDRTMNAALKIAVSEIPEATGISDRFDTALEGFKRAKNLREAAKLATGSATQAIRAAVELTDTPEQFMREIIRYAWQFIDVDAKDPDRTSLRQIMSRGNKVQFQKEFPGLPEDDELNPLVPSNLFTWYGKLHVFKLAINSKRREVTCSFELWKQPVAYWVQQQQPGVTELQAERAIALRNAMEECSPADIVAVLRDHLDAFNRADVAALLNSARRRRLDLRRAGKLERTAA